MGQFVQRKRQTRRLILLTCGLATVTILGLVAASLVLLWSSWWPGERQEQHWTPQGNELNAERLIHQKSQQGNDVPGDKKKTADRQETPNKIGESPSNITPMDWPPEVTEFYIPFHTPGDQWGRRDPFRPPEREPGIGPPIPPRKYGNDQMFHENPLDVSFRGDAEGAERYAAAESVQEVELVSPEWEKVVSKGSKLSDKLLAEVKAHHAYAPQFELSLSTDNKSIPFPVSPKETLSASDIIPIPQAALQVRFQNSSENQTPPVNHDNAALKQPKSKTAAHLSQEETGSKILGSNTALGQEKTNAQKEVIPINPEFQEKLYETGQIKHEPSKPRSRSNPIRDIWGTFLKRTDNKENPHGAMQSLSKIDQVPAVGQLQDFPSKTGPAQSKATGTDPVREVWSNFFGSSGRQKQAAKEAPESSAFGVQSQGPAEPPTPREDSAAKGDEPKDKRHQGDPVREVWSSFFSARQQQSKAETPIKEMGKPEESSEPTALRPPPAAVKMPTFTQMPSNDGRSPPLQYSIRYDPHMGAYVPVLI